MNDYTPRTTGIMLSNTETISGYDVAQVLGIAMGNTVRAKHLGKDIGAGLKSLIGGEIRAYTDMLSDARQEALNRMINNAKDMGANGIVNVRFMTSAIMTNSAELFAYGTAVILQEK